MITPCSKTFLSFLVPLFIHQAVLGQQRYTGITEATPTGSASISADGLVAAYDFATYTREGLLRDFGPFNNHGEVTQRQDAAGQFGGARIFTDLNDVVDLPENETLALTGPLTIAAHMQLSTSGLHQHILSCDDVFVLWTTENDQYKLADTQGHGLTTLAQTTPIGEWHSVVAVLATTRNESLSRQNIKIFIDGEETEGTLTETWSPVSLRPVDGCLIGASSALPLSHQQLHFEGLIDEMQVFSRALNDAEIRAYSSR